jgi:hypothetical protein
MAGDALCAARIERFDRSPDREDDACPACKGHGGTLEADDGGAYYTHDCRPCAGTGDLVWCVGCLAALPRGQEPNEALHLAYFRAVADAKPGPVSQLVCADHEHVGCAVLDVIADARRSNERHEEVRAANARLLAAVEAESAACDRVFGSDAQLCANAECARELRKNACLCFSDGKVFCGGDCAIAARRRAS